MSGLSDLQKRALIALASPDPDWRLTGGAALVGYHLHHRTTSDLDLFFGDRRVLEHEPRAIEARLVAAGLDVAVLQRSPGFVRLAVADGQQTLTVDLVAEPVPCIEEPERRAPGVWVDTAHEILVNKLTALLSRTELRDLEDVRALVEAGGDLERAMNDAPSKDGGFSPPTLAWLLQQAPMHVAADLGFDEQRLRAFRDGWVALLTAPDR